MRLTQWIGIFLAMALVPVAASANGKIDGKQLYNQYCSKCHAEDGTGSEKGKALKPFPARNHRAVAQLIGRDEMRRFITYGVAGTEMKPKKYTLNGLEIEAVIDYIKTFTYTADLKNGKKRFEAVCSKCHGKDGKATTGLGAEDLVYTQLDLIGITHAIRYGRQGTMMTSKRHQLSNKDIADISNYVYSFRYMTNLANGKKLYSNTCASCHSTPGTIKLIGNAAMGRTVTATSDRLLELRILHGRHVRRAGKKVDNLSSDEIRDIIAYMRKNI